MPKVSIITGYYNRENYVDDSIISLLNQTYTDFELIIFDDCSTDNTYKKLEKFSTTDKRIHLIKHEENIGFVNGLIKAVAMARGEYIAIHGSGDISLAERIKKQVSFLDKNSENPLVACWYLNKDPELGTIKYVKGDSTYNREIFFNHNPISQGGVMFRVEAYNASGGYRSVFKYSQDKDLWLRMAQFGPVAVLQEILYERIINYDGVSYKVEKFIEQKQYSILANILNTSPTETQQKIIDKIKLYGINVIVNKYTSDIQKHIYKMYNVLLVKNKIESPSIYIKNSKGLYKLYYKISFSITNIKLIRRGITAILKKARS